MPIRFSTEAANADVLGDDTSLGEAPKGMPRAVSAVGTSRDRDDRRDRGQANPTGNRENGGEATPGKDINAPGFIKDKDAAKP